MTEDQKRTRDIFMAGFVIGYMLSGVVLFIVNWLVP
jgi:hypothetical protein